jgi:ubiquinone/menaquinone biosynthesis C-methylase UbiE
MDNLEQELVGQIKVDIENKPDGLAVNEKLRGRYNSVASAWNEPKYSDIRRDDLMPKLLAGADLKNGQVVLEAMCGTGLPARKIAEQYPESEVVALDFSGEMLKQIPASSGIETRQASIVDTGFAAGRFDRVVLRNALYDLTQAQQVGALVEIRRIMKDDGKFVLQTYITKPETQAALNYLTNLKDEIAGNGNPDMPRHFATEEELEQWFTTAGFEFEKIGEFSSEINMETKGEMPSIQRMSEAVNGLPEEVWSQLGVAQSDGPRKAMVNVRGGIYKLTPISIQRLSEEALKNDRVALEKAHQVIGEVYMTD